LRARGLEEPHRLARKKAYAMVSEESLATPQPQAITPTSTHKYPSRTRVTPLGSHVSGAFMRGLACNSHMHSSSLSAHNSGLHHPSLSCSERLEELLTPLRKHANVHRRIMRPYRGKSTHVHHVEGDAQTAASLWHPALLRLEVQPEPLCSALTVRPPVLRPLTPHRHHNHRPSVRNWR